METAISNDDPDKMLSVLKLIKADVDATVAKTRNPRATSRTALRYMDNFLMNKLLGIIRFCLKFSHRKRASRCISRLSTFLARYNKKEKHVPKAPIVYDRPTNSHEKKKYNQTQPRVPSHHAIRTVVEELLNRYEPAQLQNIEFILKKYRGRELELIDLIGKRYAKGKPVLSTPATWLYNFMKRTMSEKGQEAAPTSIPPLTQPSTAAPAPPTALAQQMRLNQTHPPMSRFVLPRQSLIKEV